MRSMKADLVLSGAHLSHFHTGAGPNVRERWHPSAVTKRTKLHEIVAVSRRGEAMVRGTTRQTLRYRLRVGGPCSAAFPAPTNLSVP